jgi:DNA recombination protein RmuC
MEPFTLFSLLYLLAGGIIAWFLYKWILENEAVPIAEVNIMKARLYELQTQNRITEEANNTLKEQLGTNSEDLKNSNKEINLLRESLAAKGETCNSLDAMVKDAKGQLQDCKTELQQKNDALILASNILADLKAKIKFSEEKLDTQRTDIEHLGKKFEGSFRLLAQNILEDKSKSFSIEQEKKPQRHTRALTKRNTTVQARN